MSRLPRTSARLTRAAEADLVNLERAQETLMVRRESLQRQLDELDDQLADVRDHISLLERVAGPRATSNGEVLNVLAQKLVRGEDLAGTTTDHQVLQGPSIRETAVRLLVERGQVGRPLHYRRWFELVEEAGYAIAGKDPLAVFLSQVSRSPVVTRTGESGVYVIEMETVEAMRRRLAMLHRELADLARSAPADATDMTSQRERREQLMSEISQTERGLEEAIRVLGRLGVDEPEPRLAAAG
jgi:hypothetical protein